MIFSLVLIAASLVSNQQEAQRAAERIQMSQQSESMVIRAQHRDVSQVQPISHLSPEEEASNRKAEIARFLGAR